MKKGFVIIGKGTGSHLMRSLALYRKIPHVWLIGLVLLLGGCAMTDTSRDYHAGRDYRETRRTKAVSAEKERMQSPSRQPQQAETVASDNENTDAIAYQQAKSLNTLQAFAEFLHAHPSSPSRREALEATSLLIQEQNGTYENYRKFVAEYEDGLEFVPPQHRLALTGPEGIRVHDIIRLLKQGIKDTVIAAKIRTRNALYKDFDFEEIATLKKTGITDALIEAMLDSTTRAKRAQEEFQKKKEMEDLLAEIQRTQKKLDAMKAAQEQQQQQPQAADSGPSLGDTVKNCAARVVALEACRHLSGFAQLICKATAKSQFPCQE